MKKCQANKSPAYTLASYGGQADTGMIRYFKNKAAKSAVVVRRRAQA